MISGTASEDIDETIAYIRTLNSHNERLCNLKVAYPPANNATSSSTSNSKKNPQPYNKNMLYSEDDGLDELLRDIESYVNDDRDEKIETNHPYDPRIQVLEVPLINGIESSSTPVTGVPSNDEAYSNTNVVPYYQILHLDVLHHCVLSTFHVFNTLISPPNWTMIQQYVCITCYTTWIYHYPILF